MNYRINQVTALSSIYAYFIKERCNHNRKLQSYDIVYAPLPRSLKVHKSPSVSKKVK